MEHELVSQIVTKQLLDEEFGRIISSSGGWRPSLMPAYIDAVLALVWRYATDQHDYMRMRRAAIQKMKELDPVLFHRDF